MEFPRLWSVLAIVLTCLFLTLPVAVSAQTQPQPEPIHQIPKADDYPFNSIKGNVVRFLRAWEQKDYNQMARLGATSWSARKSDAAGLLEAWFEFKTLKGARIDQVEERSATVARVEMILTYASRLKGNRDVTRQVWTFVFREDQYGQMDVNGVWCVNPKNTVRR